MKHVAATALPLLLSLALAGPAAAQDHGRHHADQGAGADSADVATVVHEFHRALAAGDSARALELLAPDARILEGGGIETVEEYRAHHLPADIAFASAVRRDRDPLEITVMGDVAWAASTSRVTGTFRERDIDSRGAELVVLTRHGGAWHIAAVHWSSR